MKKQLLALALAVALPTVASAQVGIQLASDQLATLGKVRCGFVKNSWTSGTIVKKTGAFYSLGQQISDINKKLKNKKLSSKARNALLLKRTNLKTRQRQQNKVCKTLPTPGVSGQVPTPVVTPASQPPTPAPGAVITSWDVNATDIKDNLGTEYLFFCPPAPAGGLRTIYGDYTYTSDSSICAAATHASLITRGLGGNVRFRIKGEQQIYFKAIRNGVESSSFGAFATSFSFINQTTGAEITPPSAPPIGVSDSATSYDDYLGSTFTFICPPGAANGGSVWGTDIYTSDSSVCRAAIHAGKSSNASGGQVTILIIPGQLSYASSSRNGVTTSSYGQWGGSYSFQ